MEVGFRKDLHRGIGMLKAEDEIRIGRNLPKNAVLRPSLQRGIQKMPNLVLNRLKSHRTLLTAAANNGPKEGGRPPRIPMVMNASPQRAENRISGRMPPCETVVEWLDPDVDSGVGTGKSRISRFTGASGVTEWHVTLILNGGEPDPVGTLENLWLEALERAGISPESTVMRRVFCSDVLNQFPQLSDFVNAHPGAFSTIGQAPLTGGKMALWSYHVHDPQGVLENKGGGSRYSLTRGSLVHHWITGLCEPSDEDVFSQTNGVLAQHEQWMADHHMTLAENVVRTWWFVRNIDGNYQGLVDARRTHFSNNGLTEKTHYIASTGIDGEHPTPTVDISLDSYAISGLLQAQIEYLNAPEHLGPTHRYGVTFERATAVSYADRRHVFISGTASIDPAGNIVHPGDVIRQFDRALENISALLATANASFADLAMILVYLRDSEDSTKICDRIHQLLDHLPVIVLHAPVCRPGWLVEVEGIAIVATHRPEFSDF